MSDLDRCSCAGINLDKLVQPAILTLLAEQDLHGYGLIQRIMTFPLFRGEKPDPTGVYRFLKAMERRSLVAAQWDIMESGPPKKTYKITAEGKACLAQWISTLADYREAIDALVVHAAKILTGFDSDPSKSGRRRAGRPHADAETKL